MRKPLLVLAVLASACGGKSNSPVTDQGVTLKPQSSAAAVGVAFIIPVMEVIVTDVPNICGAFGSFNACNPSQSSSPLTTVTSGSILVITAFTNSTGDFKVQD